MPTIKIQLEQHTPLIHFQSNQSGAILRVTELKPRMDSFIREELKNVNISIYNEYSELIKSGKFTDYKMKVVCSQSETLCIYNQLSEKKYNDLIKKNKNFIKNTAYFGKYKGMEYTGIILEIFSFNENICNLIRICLDYVLVYENFGSRKSKGFGSFTTKGIDINKFEEILKMSKCKIYKYNKGEEDNELYENTELSKIYTSYRDLKTGENSNGKYKESLLYSEIMKQKNIESEKLMIKECLMDKYKDKFNELKCPKVELKYKDHDNYRLFRAMLGFADHYDFVVYKDKSFSFKVKHKTDKGKIERFSSPLYFKVFKNEIYLMINEISEDMFNKKFNIEFWEVVRKNKTPIDKKFLEIHTPSKTEFAIESIEMILKDKLNYREVK